MILALLLAQSVPAPTFDVPLGPIGQQALPKTGCAAYLWNINDRKLVAMVVAEPAQLRLAIDGKVADYSRTAQNGAGGFGFAATTEYRGGDVTATVRMTVSTRDEMANGAVVPEATLRIDRPGRDTVIVPVGGLIGCR